MTVLGFPELEEFALRRIAACRPCLACGEPGTWGERDICPLCHVDARNTQESHTRKRELERLREDREDTLLGLGVPRFRNVC